jgi:ribosome biogenesis SPOUT family RNA methylase Rps3
MNSYRRRTIEDRQFIEAPKVLFKKVKPSTVEIQCIIPRIVGDLLSHQIF